MAMPQKLFFFALFTLVAVVASTAVYAQQLTGKGSGGVLNLSAYDRIADRANIDLQEFMKCSSKRLLIDADGNCTLVPPPERQWQDAAGTPASPNSTTETHTFLRFQNPAEADVQIPTPEWGQTSGDLRGPRGTDGNFLYYDGSGALVATCPYHNPNCVNN